MCTPTSSTTTRTAPLSCRCPRLQWGCVRRRRSRHLQRIRPRRRRALRVRAAALVRCSARPGSAGAVDDELLARTAELGGEHEQRHLDELRSRSHVAIIGRPAYTVAGLTAAAEATLRAVDQRADVVYQAAMFDGRFVGLRRLPGARRRALPVARHQARPLGEGRGAAAAGRLRRDPGCGRRGGPRRSGVGARQRNHHGLPGRRVAAGVPVPARRLQALLDRHLASGAAVSWADDDGPSVHALSRSARRRSAGHDDLLLVAGMRVSQRARLIDAGITTMTELAQHDGRGARPAGAHRHRAERAGRLQIAPRVDGKPPYEVVDPQPLMLLPDPDKGDLFFDFEGDPLWTADGRDWGLEYMFGVVGPAAGDGDAVHGRCGRTTAPASARRSWTSWIWCASAASATRRCTSTTTRRTRRPRCCGWPGATGWARTRSTTCLRNGVLVDLYPMVRKSIRVGTENYSLKSLEPLYMGCRAARRRCHHRDGLHHHVRQVLRPARRRPRRRGLDNVLKEIEDYNRYDCRSTRKLRDWLLRPRLRSRGPAAADRSRCATAGSVEVDDELARTLGPLRRRRHDDARTPEQRAVAMIAAARGYHRREDKPFWWGHFDRLNSPVDEWSDTPGVFLADHASRRRRLACPPAGQKTTAPGAADRCDGRR